MPNKTKEEYMDLPVNPGESQTNVVLMDSVTNKGLSSTIKSIRYLANGTKEITLSDGGTEHMGAGSSKAEATADSAGQF